MFVCLDPATWEGVEQDNHTAKLSDLKLPALDVNEWMDCADAWGAKEILLVCKHSGGFCWWPTDTTDYCVKNIPWENGKGNLVKSVADACRKHGLKMGVYIYPDDPRYSKDIGRGGRTDDPKRQEEWNHLLRKQWEEVLALCGKDLVQEIWFDGSCIVPLNDIILKLAPNAVVFQGPLASIRWVGSESGVANDPDWDTLPSAAFKSGVSTQAQSTPDGDVWAPLECDTPLYGPYWFWSQSKQDSSCRNPDTLLRLYVLSVGSGSVLLLNSTPDTSGLIPAHDAKVYADFGAAIDQNFGHPVGQITRVAESTIVIPLSSPRVVNCVDLSEDYRYGQRVRHYVVEASVNGYWRQVAEGTAVGRRKIDLFQEVTTDKIRVRVTEQVGTPLFRQILVDKASQTLVASLRQIPTSVLRGATATASSVHSAPYEAKYLIDGNMNSRWGAADRDLLAWVEFDMRRPRRFASMQASELGDRVQEFQIEVRNTPDQPWSKIFAGGRIGSAYGANLPATTARYVRFEVTKNDGGLGPTMWELGLQDRPEAWEDAGTRALTAGGQQQFDIDLSSQVSDPGQYEIHIEGAAPASAQPLFEGQPGDDHFLEKIDASTYRLNRTQAIAEGSSTGIRVKFEPTGSGNFKVSIRPWQLEK